METKNAPLPWKRNKYDEIVDAGNKRVAVNNFALGGMASRATCDANDDLIIRACNSHEQLVALLVESQDSIGGDWRERRDAIIAKITGAA